MQKITIEQLQEYLDTHDNGVLTFGEHGKGKGEFCALECVGQIRGVEWTDHPESVGMPDLRELNDSPDWSSDKARTVALLPVLAACSLWATWGSARHATFLERVHIRVFGGPPNARYMDALVKHYARGPLMQYICAQGDKALRTEEEPRENGLVRLCDIIREEADRMEVDIVTHR